MKTVRQICEWCMNTLVVGVIAAALLVNLNSTGDNVSNTNPTGQKAAAAGKVNVPQSSSHFLDLIPDGGSMTYDEFKAAAGADVAKLLSWASPQKVTRKGNRLIIDSASGASTTTGGVTVTIGSRVEFEVDTTAPGLAAKNIKGVKVKKGILGPFPIHQASMTVDQATGNIEIKGKLDLGWLLPYYDFDITLGPDGKPLP